MKGSKIADVPAKSGVYELKSFGSDGPIYIGKAKNLKERLLTHLRERNPNKFRYKKTSFFGRSHHELEEKHIERYKNKNGGRIPDWNKQDPSENSSGLF